MGQPETSNEQRQMTEGEEAVGLNSNPSNNLEVQRAKELCSELFDLVERQIIANDQLDTITKIKMRDKALSEIITARMWAVKVITLNK